MPHLLIADDDADLARAVSWYLEAEGYRVTVAADGQAAWRVCRDDPPDAALLDIMMPGLDGVTLCARLREQSDLPILMLSARAEEADKVRALSLGADDYVTKPFGALELVARVKALLRRARRGEDVLRAHGLEVRVAEREVLVQGQAVRLSALEFDLLVTLLRRARTVFTRDQLAELVWGQDFYGDPRLVDSHIYRLRQKLGAAGLEPCPIVTVRGVGYAFRSEG